MHAIAVAQDRVHAEPAVARLPLARVLVVADARDHLPGIAAVARCGRATPARRRTRGPSCRRPASSDQMLASARPSSFGKAGADFVSLNFLPEIGRAQDLHAEEGVAARGVEARRAARVDQRGVDGHARSERPAQREAAPGLRRLGDEQALLGSDAENDSFRHVQPPETAGRIVTTSPGVERRVEPVAVAHVRRVHEQVDVAAHRARLVADAAVQRRMVAARVSSSAARTLAADSDNSEAPSQ